MPWYMIQLGYRPDAWEALIDKPVNRIEVVRPLIEGLGGKVHDGWLSFGEYDVVAICEMPDNVTAAAFSIAVEGGGGVEGFKTTPLLTMDEALAAMKKAGDIKYEAPQ